MGEFIEDASHTISKIGHCDVRMGAPWIEKLQILCGEGKREIGVNDKKKEDILKRPSPFPTFELNYLYLCRMKRTIYPTLKMAITKAMLMIQDGATYPIAIFNTLTREWMWEIRIEAEKSLIERFSEIVEQEGEGGTP